MRKRIYTDEERKERERECKRRWRAQNPEKVREMCEVGGLEKARIVLDGLCTFDLECKIKNQ